MKRALKTIAVILVAGVLSTLTINAGDNMGNFSNSFLAGVIPAFSPSPCSKDMVFVGTEMGGFCIDIYEASASDDCLYVVPANEHQTQENINMAGCMAVSEKRKQPWVYIPQHQAVLACANAGKRLPTPQEWYRAVLGTPDNGDACNTHNIKDGKADRTGDNELCKSPLGTYDMIGNVWEWVDATVVDRMHNGKELPQAGFVSGIDGDGMPTNTTDKPNLSFNGDYFWAEDVGTQGIFRGGYWGLEGKAGMYSLHAGVPATFIGNGVGFRCVK